MKNKTLAQVISGEFCKISKNNFSYRASPVAYLNVTDSFKDIVNSTKQVKPWKTKHQSCVKVLHKFYYLKRDISATLVEVVFKMTKSLKMASTSVAKISHFK